MKKTWGEPFTIQYYAEPTFGIQIPPADPAKGITIQVHKKENCVGRNCVIHNPSDHALKDARLNWRGDRALMERVCEHGVGHPDPDDIAYKMTVDPKNAWAEAVHGCDGCCRSAKVAP